jgi:hypothetical protein
MPACRVYAAGTGGASGTSSPGSACAGYLSKRRQGRRNRYEVHEKLPLRHPEHRHHTVGDLIGFLEAPASPANRQTALAATDPVEPIASGSA